MPTPVPVARQCLTPAAAAALDDAVAVARRRGHSQTTSLHMVSALLSLSNSSLREACARARTHGAAYSARVQFKALELSLTVSLDRMPSNSQNRSDTEPPVSNSLMAAVKRSQANQRRQPENYPFYQHHHHQQYPSSSSSSSSPSIPVVKVELQNLIISILDDPLVSRVFGEAGFRNFDIKMAVLRKGNAQVFGCTSRYKRSNPPLFLCNFPVVGGCFSGGDESARRVGEIMRRGKKKCPLLLGVSAADALKVFLEKISSNDNKGVVLGDGVGGVRVVCVKDEIFRCLNGDSDDGPLQSKLEEVEKTVGDNVVVSFGDLKEFGGDTVNSESLRFVVRKLSELVEVYSGRLWLIGFAANYKVYYKVLERMPAIEEGWDLEVLPITSFKFSVGGSYPRSSLMESFVPLGGFFPMPQEMKSPPSSNACQTMVRCHLCNEKYEQEVAALTKGEHLRASVGQQSQSSLPSWLQSPAQPRPWSGSCSIKGKDDSLLLNAKITGLQRKWDDICQQHHFGQTFFKGYQSPHFQLAGDRKENETNNVTNNSNQSLKEQGNENASIVLSSSVEIPLESKEEAGADKSPPSYSLNAGIIDSDKSPTSVTSMTTDLGLGMLSKCPSQLSSCPHEAKDPKSIYKALVGRVAHQEEAIHVIVDTITKVGCQNVWINIRGPDRLGKRKLGLAIAETLYGSNESLIYVDLSFQNGTTPTETMFDRLMANKYDLAMRGTVVDYLVEKLSKNPSVVFLENIDKADLVVQNSLLQALKTGRLTDLRGREVNFSNCIFLGTTKNSGGTKGKTYTEEDVLMAKGGSVQITIGFDLNDDPTDKNPPRFLTNKRKHVKKNTSERALRSKSCLDLNLPVSSESWAENFDGRMHRVVDFEPLDFDGLAERVLGEIRLCLGKVGGCECSMEIEPDVIRQVLAGAYLFGDKRVEDWVRGVVSEAFSEAMGKYGVDGRSVVKIGRCDRDGSEEVLLPERILIK